MSTVMYVINLWLKTIKKEFKKSFDSFATRVSMKRLDSGLLVFRESFMYQANTLIR